MWHLQRHVLHLRQQFLPDGRLYGVTYAALQSLLQGLLVTSGRVVNSYTNSNVTFAYRSFTKTFALGTVAPKPKSDVLEEDF